MPLFLCLACCVSFLALPVGDNSALGFQDSSSAAVEDTTVESSAPLAEKNSEHAAGPDTGDSHAAPPRGGGTRPLMQRLSPEQKAKVYVMLSTVIFLGALMILIVWLGARATRRYIRNESVHRPVSPRRRGVDEDDWAKKPLVPPVGTDDENDSA